MTDQIPATDRTLPALDLNAMMEDNARLEGADKERVEKQISVYMSAQAVKAALAQANGDEEPPCPKQKLHRQSTTQANVDNLIQMIYGY